MTRLDPVPYGMDILRLRASKGDPDADTSITWRATYDVGDLTESGRRAVIATLQVRAASGWGDISVVSLYSNTEGMDVADLEATVRTSDATEALYDFARSHLAPLMTVVGARIEFPLMSPPVEVGSFDSNSALAEEGRSDEDLEPSPVSDDLA